MVHQFGSSEDYDKLARDTGDPSWSWNKIRKYINVVRSSHSRLNPAIYTSVQHERIVPPADGHRIEGEFIPENHGTQGTLPVSLPGNPQGIDKRMIDTTKELPGEFPFNRDQGGGDVLGIGWTQNSIGNGERSSSSTTYLAEALKRGNVDVLLNAHVMKLVQTGTNKLPRGYRVPVFRALQFSKGPGGTWTIKSTAFPP